MDSIIVPRDLTRITEPELLALAAKCAQVQSAALSELQARPERQSEYEKRLLMLPPWRQTMVKALSSKLLMVAVAIIIGIVSFGASFVEFARDSEDVRDAWQVKEEELRRLEAQKAGQ
jgi:hypothetical protein